MTTENNLNEQDALNKLKEFGTIREYDDGAVVCLEDSPGNEIYIIKSGKVEVLKKGKEKNISLAKLDENELFGEISVFSGERRSATVKAIGKSTVWVIDKSTLKKVLVENPSLAMLFLKTIAIRLFKLDRQIFKYCNDGSLEAKKVVRFYSHSRGKSKISTFY